MRKGGVRDAIDQLGTLVALGDHCLAGERARRIAGVIEILKNAISDNRIAVCYRCEIETTVEATWAALHLTEGKYRYCKDKVACYNTQRDIAAIG